MKSQWSSRNFFIYILTVVVFLQLLTLLSLRDGSARGVSDVMIQSRGTNLRLNNKQTWRQSDQCQVIHLALIVWNQEEARKVSDFLKTTLHSRSRPLHLHLLVTGLTHQIMSTLLDTWEMIDVQYSLYELNLPEKDTLLWRAQRFSVLVHLPDTVQEVIFVDNSIRILSDISLLKKDLHNTNAVAVSTDTQCVNQSRFITADDISTLSSLIKNSCAWPEILYFNRSALLQNQKLSHLVYAPSNNNSKIEQLLKRFWEGGNQFSDIPCTWTLKLNKHDDIMKCLGSRTVQGVIWSDSGLSSFSNQYVEKLKEVVNGITSSQPLPRGIQHASMICSEFSTYVSTEHLQNSSCTTYRYVAALKHRTHLYYLGSPPLIKPVWDPYEVTLLVQTTLDRFNVLEVLLKNWNGPATIVFYVTDDEAAILPSKVHASSAIRDRKNTAIHAVYKRTKYNPINYLRNVALNHTTTPYLLTLDVDLVPNPNLYNSIKQRLVELKSKNQLLLVPAFQAFVDLKDNPPLNKTELLELMEQDKLDGYRMREKWRLGHQPTNYPLWKKATELYRAIFHDAFEPYLVVPRSESARYHEGLLERMGDKIAYVRLLHGKGYDFMVLPDDFIIHMPHPTSADTQRARSEPMFLRCAGRLFEQYRKELYELFPNRTF